MKKIILIGGIVLMTATVTFGRNSIDPTGGKEARDGRREARRELRRERRAEDKYDVSIPARNQLAIDFPEAKNLQFKRTKNFEEVSFLSGKKRQMTAYYDYDNELVGATQERVFTDLPENAQKRILKDYADYTIGQVIKYIDNENNDYGMILYGTVFDASNYFVELEKAGKAIVVKADLAGNVSYFTDMK